MADQPGSRAPSAPLSAEDADRLAESFTPFWEDDGSEQAEFPPPNAAMPGAALPGPQVGAGPAAPGASSAMGAPATALPAAAPPAPLAPAVGGAQANQRSINKQTLLGMAPFTGERRPPAPPPAAQALPQAQPTPPPAGSTLPFPALSPAQAATVLAERPIAPPATQPMAEVSALQPAPAVTTQPLPAVPEPRPQPAPVATTQLIPAVSAPQPQPVPIATTQPLPAVPAAQPNAIATTQPLPAVAAQPVELAALEGASTDARPPPTIKHNQTLVGFAVPTPEARGDGATAPPPSELREAPHPAVQRSSPAVPGYAIAYTPKDDPSTPAVVIAPEAQSRPVSVDVPPGSFAPKTPALATPVQAEPLAAATADDVDVELFLPKRRSRSLIAAAIGIPLLLLVGALGLHALRDEPKPPVSANRSEGQLVPSGPATASTTVATSPKREDSAPPPPPPVAASPPPTAVAAPHEVKPRPAGRAKPERTTVAAPPTRPATRSPSSSFPSEPKAAPSKGVIVRDAPF